MQRDREWEKENIRYVPSKKRGPLFFVDPSSLRSVDTGKRTSRALGTFVPKVLKADDLFPAKPSQSAEE